MDAERTCEFVEMNQVHIRELIDALGASIVNTNLNIQQLAGVVANQNRDDRDRNGGFRQLKPKKDLTNITAEDAASFMIQMLQFEIDLGEIGLSARSEA